MHLTAHYDLVWVVFFGFACGFVGLGFFFLFFFKKLTRKIDALQKFTIKPKNFPDACMCVCIHVHK